MGRPSTFSQEIADTICERIIAGESARAIARDDDMPAMSTIFLWLSRHSSFSEQYAHAKSLQADAMAEEIAEIADDGRNDWMSVNGNNDPGWRVNGEHVQRSRLRVDTRKWLMAKMAPKKYSEKLQAEVTGADGGPIEHRFRWAES